ncbi:MAG: hypothetical protein IJY85_00850 [Ruminococcus sp.]|nr:hypothetical protein [Ruminococcus sp.]
MRFEEEYRIGNQMKQLDEQMIRKLASEMTEAAIGEHEQRKFYFADSPPSKSQWLISAVGVAAAAAFAAIVVLPQLANEGRDPHIAESGAVIEYMTSISMQNESESVTTQTDVRADYPVYALNTLVAQSDLIVVADVTKVKYVTTTTDSFWTSDSLYAVYEIRVQEKLKGDMVSGGSLQILLSQAEFAQFGELAVKTNGDEQYLFFLSVSDSGRGRCRLMNPFQSCYRTEYNQLDSIQMPSVMEGEYALSITMQDVRQAVDLDRFGWLETICSLRELCKDADVVVNGTIRGDETCFCEQEGGMHYKIYADYVLSGNMNENQEFSLCLTQEQMVLMPEFTNDKSYLFFLRSAEDQYALYVPLSTSQGIYYYGSNTPYLYSAVGNQSIPTFTLEETELILDEINAEPDKADAVCQEEELKRKMNCEKIMQEYSAAQMEGSEYRNTDKINRYLNELFFIDTQLPDGATFSSIRKEDTELMTWLVQQALAEIWRENHRIAQTGQEIMFSGGTAEWLEEILRKTISPEITLPDGADYTALAGACNGLEYGEDGFYQTLPNGWGIMDEIRLGGSALFYHVTRAYEYDGKIYAAAYKYLLQVDEKGNGLVYDGDTQAYMGTFEIEADGELAMTVDSVVPSEEIFVLEDAEERSTYGYYLVTKK